MLITDDETGEYPGIVSLGQRWRFTRNSVICGLYVALSEYLHTIKHKIMSRSDPYEGRSRNLKK